MIIHASHQRHIYFCETGDLATVNSLKICILTTRTYIYVHYSSALDTNQNRENNIWKITNQINGIIIRQLSAVVVCAIWGTILKTSFLILNIHIYTLHCLRKKIEDVYFRRLIYMFLVVLVFGGVGGGGGGGWDSGRWQ